MDCFCLVRKQISVLACLAALLFYTSSSAVARDTPKPAASAPALAAKPPWGRIVVVGASASSGFTESEPFGGPLTPKLRLSRYLDAALLAPHEPVRNLASALFFTQPEELGLHQIEASLKANPTLIVGIDFLFWFCYGSEAQSDEERSLRFESGLKLLEKITCPLVIGDIPDASGAADTMLGKEQIASPAAISAANRRLKEWAANHPNVVVVSLSSFMRTVVANEALNVRGHTLPQGKTSGLLQPDKLHPNPHGSTVLALVILDAFQSAQANVPAADVRWDPREVYRVGFNSSPPVPATAGSPLAPASK